MSCLVHTDDLQFLTFTTRPLFVNRIPYKEWNDFKEPSVNKYILKTYGHDLYQEVAVHSNCLNEIVSAITQSNSSKTKHGCEIHDNLILVWGILGETVSLHCTNLT
jgi:hypothetical protein